MWNRSKTRKEREKNHHRRTEEKKIATFTEKRFKLVGESATSRSGAIQTTKISYINCSWNEPCMLIWMPKHIELKPLCNHLFVVSSVFTLWHPLSNRSLSSHSRIHLLLVGLHYPFSLCTHINVIYVLLIIAACYLRYFSGTCLYYDLNVLSTSVGWCLMHIINRFTYMLNQIHSIFSNWLFCQLHI